VAVRMVSDPQCEGPGVKRIRVCVSNQFYTTMESLYVLQLADDKYYVGKSADVTKRFGQHKNGSGAAWTKVYSPIKILEVKPITSPHDENNVTKDYMKKYGIGNVRGGSYTSVDLPGSVRSLLQTEIRGGSDACYKCGGKGHFANACIEDVIEDEEEEEEDGDGSDRDTEDDDSSEDTDIDSDTEDDDSSDDVDSDSDTEDEDSSDDDDSE
jgi:predicted GIY-YIG superfamily endonuclease